MSCRNLVSYPIWWHGIVYTVYTSILEKVIFLAYMTKTYTAYIFAVAYMGKRIKQRIFGPAPGSSKLQLTLAHSGAASDDTGNLSCFQ